MATRSAIALQSGESFLAVYCHWDGYPSHQLPILRNQYKTVKQAAALIAPGDLSTLQASSDWQLEPIAEPRPLYYKERGESNVSPRSFASFSELIDWADGCNCEHIYFYKPRKGWQHHEILHEPLPASPMPGCDPAHW